MARLQILELPEVFVGEASETPFVLVVDEMPTDEAAFDALRRDLNNLNADVAKRIGARAVLCFETTVDIPANEIGQQAEPLLHVGEFEGDEEIQRLTEQRDELHAEIGLAHGQLHSAALSAIRGKHANIRELIERAAALDEALSSIRSVHAPVEHRGQIICKECSGLDPDGSSTDNAPVLHEQCRTSRIACTAQSADA